MAIYGNGYPPVSSNMAGVLEHVPLKSVIFLAINLHSVRGFSAMFDYYIIFKDQNISKYIKISDETALVHVFGVLSGFHPCFRLLLNKLQDVFVRLFGEVTNISSF